MPSSTCLTRYPVELSRLFHPVHININLLISESDQSVYVFDFLSAEIDRFTGKPTHLLSNIVRSVTCIWLYSQLYLI
jgi:hypothetical protein